jgi:hypothetical protein
MDAAAVHPLGGLGDRLVRMGGRHLGGHDLLGGAAGCLGAFLQVAQAPLLRTAWAGQLLGLLEQQVALGDDPEHMPGVGDHGHGGHPLPAEQHHQLVELRGFARDHHGPGHHVLHGHGIVGSWSASPVFQASLATAGMSR